MQKIQIIGFFFLKIGYIVLFGVEKISTNNCFRLHIYLSTNKTLIYYSVYVLDNWGKMQAIRGCDTIAVRKCLLEVPRSSGYLAIRITSIHISGVLL